MVKFTRVSLSLIAAVGLGLGAASFGAAALADSGHGKGSSNGGNGNGGNGSSNSSHGVSEASRSGSDTPKGSDASALGSLNVSHASPTALLHAAPNSRVGKIAAYKTAVLTVNADTAKYQADLATLNTCAGPSCTDAEAQVTLDQKTLSAAIDKAAAALVAASNKPITVAVVTKVDSNLKVNVDAQTAATIAATADKLQ